MARRDRTGWLGRQEIEPGNGGSKSKWFALFINAHSEKSQKFDLNSFRRLADISERRDAPPAPCPDAPPALRRQRSQFARAFRERGRLERALCDQGINAHSEKSRKFDLNSFKRLADISECRDAPPAPCPDAPPALRRQRSQFARAFRERGRFRTGALRSGRSPTARRFIRPPPPGIAPRIRRARRGLRARGSPPRRSGSGWQ